MYPNNIKALALELTDKCQASCPMCLRNYNGGPERNFVKNVEITLDEFKAWFPPEFLSNLDNCYACGNLGDPIVAKDTLEIFKYVRSCNATCRLAIHTNGSMRTPKWWAELATVLAPNGVVIFGIDGFKGEHELYRKGTNWDKVIENATAFIQAGGNAAADTLVFKHNEDRVFELKEFLIGIGFSYVNIKTTPRFYNYDTCAVQDNKGNHLYNIHPPENEIWKPVIFKPNTVKLVSKSAYQQLLDNAIIDSKCVKEQEIYINAQGQVFPCATSVVRDDFDVEEADESLNVLRSRMVEANRYLIEDIGAIDLHGTNIIDALAASNWATRLPKHWNENKNFLCVKHCASNLKSLTE